MKAFLRVASVVFILLLALPFVLQLRGVEVEDGKMELLYVPLNGGNAKGSVGADLSKTLRETYGEENVPMETAGRWQDRDVIISDTYTYEKAYIGKTPGGWAEYIQCTVMTSRKIKDVVTGEGLASGMQISTVLARNELGNEKRAYVLWETMKEEFYGSGFDAEPAS